jgi:hypothetical protein
MIWAFIYWVSYDAGRNEGSHEKLVEIQTAHLNANQTFRSESAFSPILITILWALR